MSESAVCVDHSALTNAQKPRAIGKLNCKLDLIFFEVMDAIRLATVFKEVIQITYVTCTHKCSAETSFSGLEG